MSSNEGHIPGSESQEKYESAVLDFLNKEMAAVQPVQKQDGQSEELDALVSDLLKQVIAESDQSQTGQKIVPEEMESLLSEFQSEPEQAAPSNGKTLRSPAVTPAASVNVGQGDSIKTAERESKRLFPTIPSDFIFRPLLTPRKKIPMIAVAAACVVAVAGFAIYHFSGSTKSVQKTASSQPNVAAPIVPQKQSMPAALQPTGKTVPDKSPVTKRASNLSPAVPVQKPGTVQQAVKPGKETPVPAKMEAAVKPASAAPDNEPKPAMEKPPAVQPASPTQAAVASSPAIEKPAQPVVSNNAALANAAPEKRPAQPAPAAPVSVENSVPASQPPAPMVSKVMVPAVPIAQTSAVYPEIALRTRSSGSVVLDLQIDEQGKVVKATPVSGPVLFHNAAVAAALKWRYRPASIGGQNVPSESRVTMKFNLK
jgi:TonB family protein